MFKYLIGSNQYKQISTDFGVVGKNAKFNAVKLLIDSNLNWSDVIVTEDGTKNSKALGWITNIILTEKSKVWPTLGISLNRAYPVSSQAMQLIPQWAVFPQTTVRMAGVRLAEMRPHTTFRPWAPPWRSF